MATLYTQAEHNVRKTWLYLTFFLIFIIGLGWLVSYILDSFFILWLAVGYSFFMSFFSYWFSDKIVLAVSQAKPIEKRDNPELYRLVENLCIAAGLPLPKIYVIKADQPNAFATGRDAKHAVVAVTQGLLDRLERVELEGVIAHELSHIGNRDILLATIIVILVGVVVMLTDVFLRISFWGGLSRRDSREGGQIRIGLIVFGLVLAVLAPLFAVLIKMAISRKREFLADADAALLTRYPEGLARALEKISRSPDFLPGATDATSHLYILNPFRGKERKSWFHRLFMTHPPVKARIRVLRGMRI